MSGVERRLQGLGVSLLFHGALVGLALWLWNRPPSPDESEMSTWDVSLQSQEAPKSDPPMLEMEPEPEAAAEPVAQTLDQAQAPELAAGPPQFSALPAVDISGLRPATGAASVGAVPIPVPASGLSSLFASPSGSTGGGRAGMGLPDFGGGGLSPVVRIPPTYPIEARRKKIEGWVRVELTVLEDGSVADVRVREAKPPGIFEDAAKAAVSRWKFRPAAQDGKPVRRRAAQTLRFQLQD